MTSQFFILLNHIYSIITGRCILVLHCVFWCSRSLSFGRTLLLDGPRFVCCFRWKHFSCSSKNIFLSWRKQYTPSTLVFMFILVNICYTISLFTRNILALIIKRSYGCKLWICGHIYHCFMKKSVRYKLLNKYLLDTSSNFNRYIKIIICSTQQQNMRIKNK